MGTIYMFTPAVISFAIAQATLSITTERSEWRNLFNICFMTDMKARELLDRAEELRRNCRFGEAINFYRAAAAAPDATDEIKRKSLASVELMQEINGFVNTDLMNP